MKRDTYKRTPDDDAGPLLDDDDPLKGYHPAASRRTTPRFWLRAILVLVLLLALLVGLLPRLLSLTPFRNLILEKINARLAPASLTVEDWSLRWFGGMSFSGLKFADPTRHADVQVVQITTSGGLFNMLPMGKMNLGSITVDAPQATVRLPKQGDAEEEPVAKPAAPSAAGHVPQLCGKLLVQGGRIEVLGAGATPFVMEHVKLTTDVKSMRDPVEVSLAAFVPWKDDAGVISIEGSVPRPEYLLVGGTPSQERLKFGVKQLDLQGFRALLESLTGQPWIRGGVADGSILLSYRGREAAQVQADLAVRQLSVEPPGKPVSPPGDIRLLATLDYADGQLSIGQLSCASPWLSLLADGQFALQPDANGRRIGNLKGKAEIDLQTLTRDFGSLLQLRDDFRVEHGQLRMDAALSGTAESLEIKVGLVSSNLALRSGAELFEMRPSPAARVHVVLPYEQPMEVRELLVDLPFAHVTGKGRLDEAEVRVVADLAAFTKDFRRLLVNCPAMSGVVAADLKSHAEGGRVSLDASASASGVSSKWQDGRSLALTKGTLKISCRAPLVNSRLLPDITDIQMALESDAGSISGSVARLVAGVSNQPPILVDGQFRAEMDLAATRRFAGPFISQLPLDAALAGKWVANVTASMAGGVAKVRINTVAQELRLITTAWDVREDDLRIRLSADADLTKRSIKIFATQLESRLMTLALPDWQLQLPGNGQTLTMQGSLRGEANLAVLSEWQRTGKSGPPPQWEGKVSFQALGSCEQQRVTITLQAALDAFRFAATNGTPFVEPHAEIALKASLPEDARRMTLELLSLKSSLADLEAKGAVESLTGKPLADLSGTAGVNFGNVNKLLRVRGFKYPIVSGHKTRPFMLSGPVDGGSASILSYGKAKATVYLESAAAYGLTAAPADLGATLGSGVLQLDYQPSLNQGKMIFTPSVEVTRVPMLLSFPPKTRLLQDVQLTQEMLDDGLMLLLPLLHGSSVLGGTLDLTFQECHVPLGASITNDMTFRTSLTLHNLRLAPAGTLGTILDITGHSGREISIAQYEITADCQRGRVKPSDLVFQVSGSPVTLSGSVGLNGSLAYTAIVPLSKSLVGKELARYVEGASLHVPITGTINAPVIDHKALDAEVKRLVREALRKGAASALGGLLKDLKK
ncbi:MAG: hypothetical protein WCR06_03410 [bacterium]